MFEKDKVALTEFFRVEFCRGGGYDGGGRRFKEILEVDGFNGERARCSSVEVKE